MLLLLPSIVRNSTPERSIVAGTSRASKTLTISRAERFRVVIQLLQDDDPGKGIRTDIPTMPCRAIAKAFHSAINRIHGGALPTLHRTHRQTTGSTRRQGASNDQHRGGYEQRVTRIARGEEGVAIPQIVQSNLVLAQIGAMSIRNLGKIRFFLVRRTDRLWMVSETKKCKTSAFLGNGAQWLSVAFASGSTPDMRG